MAQALPPRPGVQPSFTPHYVAQRLKEPYGIIVTPNTSTVRASLSFPRPGKLFEVLTNVASGVKFLPSKGDPLYKDVNVYVAEQWFGIVDIEQRTTGPLSEASVRARLTSHAQAEMPVKDAIAILSKAVTHPGSALLLVLSGWPAGSGGADGHAAVTCTELTVSKPLWVRENCLGYSCQTCTPHLDTHQGTPFAYKPQ